MSKRINVNPGQYKVAGRERMGENLGQDQDKERMARKQSEISRASASPPRPARRGKKGR